jgi:hypothetical protein
MPHRTGWLVGLGVGLLLTPGGRAAEEPADPDKAVTTALAVNAALSRGRELLREGRCREAVEVLEKELPRIDGNPRYLAALREAYGAYVKELWLTNHTDQLALYRKKLRILDPSADAEPVASAAPSPTGPPPAGPPRPAAGAPPTLPPLASPAAPPPASAGQRAPLPVSGATTTPPVSAPPTARPEEAQPDRRVRAQSGEDPFQQVSVARGKADALAQRAHQAFQRRDYVEAGQLFNDALRLEPAAVTAFGEEAAYAKMYVVTESLNQPAGTAGPSAEELEREVQEALHLLRRPVPGLTSQGQSLLAKIHSRKPGRAAAAPASPTAGEPDAAGWTVRETANFRVCHRGSPELAEQVAQQAEQARQRMYDRWYGPAGGNWSPRCTVFLHTDAAAYSQATGKPANSPGHATLSTQGTQVVTRRLDLHCDDINLLTDTLPHEATHVVLADVFGDQVLPRWADEGMASLSEGPAQQDRYRRGLERCRQDGSLLAVAQLMNSPRYPEGAGAATAYHVQGISLVGFLVQQRDGRAFTMFLRESPRRGYEACLQRHYGIKSFADLEARWKRASLADPAGGYQGGQ